LAKGRDSPLENQRKRVMKISEKTTGCKGEALLAGAVFILALLLFLPVLENGFVNWDDPLYVYENLHIRHLDIRWIFTAVVASNYHPLTLLSHTLDYALFGLNPMGHHLTSAIFHGLNSALVFLLAKRLLHKAAGHGRTLGALTAAMLFAFHPLHVESVAWVSERKDVLSAFFFLLSILAYLRYTEKGHDKKYYGLTLLAFILALLSKPMAVTLPVVLLIIDYYPLKRDSNGWTRLVIEKIPFFALSVASAIVTLWAQRAGHGLRGLETHSLSTRIYIALRAVTFYLQKIILPIKLSPYYPLPFNTGLVSSGFIISLAVVTLITLLCLLALKRQRWPMALWAFYLVTLLPVSGLVTVGGQATADRYAYIPTMGFFMLAGVIISRLACRGKGEARGRKKSAAVALIIVILVIFAVQTIRQEAIWADSITLMSRAIELYPRRAVIPYNNRGLAYDRRGNLQLALSDYNSAIAISPEFTDAYINRGIVYGESSLFEKAINDFSRALEIDQSNAKAYMNRGAARLGTGDYAGALGDLKRGTALDPGDARGLFNLGLAYLNAGEREKGLKNMRKAAELGLAEAREFLSRGE